MIKEIRIGMHEILNLLPSNYSVMHLLKEKGFPCNDSVLDPKPRDGLEYFEYHDYKTDEIVVRWEE